MDRTERFYKIDQLLSERKVVPFAVLQEKLEVSRATIKRDLEYLRSRLNAPIVWDREARGYRFGSPEQVGAGDRYELPGLWFSSEEILALLTMQHLLANLDRGGLLGAQVEPMQARLRGLLGSADNSAEEVQKRVRILGMAARSTPLDQFSLVGSALLKRKRLSINYFARGRGENSEREISPLRLVHYRDNWYLDAWCHLRQGLRSFSLDAMHAVQLLASPAVDVPEDQLDADLGAGYGIFSGREVQWARLRFTAERARWVASETWHPNQKGHFDADGSYLLELPYSDDRELLMDILRQGRGVAVLAPSELRRRVAEELRAAASSYD
ncbi:MAG: YafY family protein [Rhodocyclaceae bacterium]|nr:YafY family protein [Rhodocyclaceae bacterium]